MSEVKHFAAAIPIEDKFKDMLESQSSFRGNSRNAAVTRKGKDDIEKRLAKKAKTDVEAADGMDWRMRFDKKRRVSSYKSLMDDISNLYSDIADDELATKVHPLDIAPFKDRLQKASDTDTLEKFFVTSSGALSEEGIELEKTCSQHMFGYLLRFRIMPLAVYSACGGAPSGPIAGAELIRAPYEEKCSGDSVVLF